MKFKKINPSVEEVRSIYHLMISGIAPRPIALVSSLDRNNNANLAPFSFFNGFGANPPIVGFSPALSGRTGLPKDTLLNIKETKQFSISVVTSDMVDQVNLSSCEFDKNIDEFIKAGFTKLKLDIVKAPGVKESPFIMECKLHKIIDLGGKPASGNLILGEVLLFHVNENILDISGKVDPVKIDLVGRNGGAWYSEVKKSLFKINKPDGIGIGFDDLPQFILDTDLTGKELAKLARVSKKPSIIVDNSIINISFKNLISKIKSFLAQDDIDKAWQFILNWDKNND